MNSNLLKQTIDNLYEEYRKVIDNKISKTYIVQ